MKTLELTADRPGERLDVLLARLAVELSRSQARRLIEEEEPGFWEMYGYHIRGDPWKEERYS